MLKLMLLTLDEGYLLTAALPDLQCGIAPLGPPAPALPSLLGDGVSPPGCGPWPRAWGRSSWPPLFGHRVLPASAPDLGRGVAPLGCAKCRSQPPTLNAPVAAKINKTKAGSLRR